MTFDGNTHHRRSIRLAGYDYASAGAYFVTVCTHRRKCLFGAVEGETVRLNPYGSVARYEWSRSAAHRPEIELDAFVVMPNHVHGIVIITDTVGAQRVAPPQRVALPGAEHVPPLPGIRENENRPFYRAPGSLGSFVAGFKMAVAKRVNLSRGTPGARVWQRNYYERIIRDDDEAMALRAYIYENAGRWPEDDYYP
jgi:REP element-mobilizing transposase RayT